MKTLIITILVVLISIQAFAQNLWQELKPPTVDPSCIAVSSNGNVFINYEADLHRSTDNGQSWENINPGAPSFSYVGTSPTGVIYFISDLLRKSTDEGNTWITLNSPFNPYLIIREPNPIMTNSAGDIFIQFDNNPHKYTYRSTDEGNSWAEIGIDSSIMVDIIFNKNLCFASFWGPGIEGLLYKSSNKGDDWELISSAPDEIYTLFAAKNGILYCGTPWGGVPAGHLFKSADNGITWEIVDEFNTISVIDIEENRLGHILIAAGSGVYRSTDNGDSWHQFTSGLLHIPPWKLAVDSLGYVYAGTGVPQMLYITVQSTIPVELISFSAIQIDNNIHLNWQTATELNNHGFEIERKTENSDWRTIGFKEGNGTTTEEQDYSFIDKNLLNGKHQYRLKQIDFDGTFEFSKTIEVEVLVIYNFMLNQNYPNPFNPVTTIRYELAEESIVTLTVYDVLGNEIEMLVNKEKPTGNYEVEFTGTGLPSGIFFYRLQTDSFVEMKKMILIK